MERRLHQKMAGIVGAAALAAVLAWPAANLQPAQAQTAGGWKTAWAEKLGVELEKTFDSSGADAWDPAKHPLVFVTSEGPGYNGLLSGVKLPGLAIFDADSREVVTSKNYDVFSWGWKSVMEPHGLGVSPNGDWIYVPTGEGSFGTQNAGRLLIINARTLKVDKVLKLKSNPHHVKSFRDGDGKPLVLVESFGGSQEPFILDPAADNKVVGGITKEELNGKSSALGFVSPDGKELFIAAGTQHERYDILKVKEEPHSAVFRIDTKTWKQKGSPIDVPDGNVIWTAFSADGKLAYFSGSHGSSIFKYDRTADKIRSYARAGAEGPYGLMLDWQDKLIYAVGKGESSHNRGKVLGVVDTELMDKPHQTFAMDQFTTNCVRGDHSTLHPDPEANEAWLSCNSSFEIVIFDLDEKKVTQRLRLPNGGSTHSGAFVKYAGWKGEVVSDQNGLQGSALAEKKKLAGAK